MTKAANTLFFVLFVIDIALIVSLWNHREAPRLNWYCGTKSAAERAEAAERAARTRMDIAKQPFQYLLSDVASIFEGASQLQRKFLRVFVSSKVGSELEVTKTEQEIIQS